MEIKEIRKIVELYFNMDISIKSRERHLVDARKMYFGLCYEFCKETLTKMGTSVGRDHSTVLYNVRSCKDLRKTDRFFNDKYIALYNLVCLHKQKKIKKTIYTMPRAIHPGFLRYADKKSIRKVFNKRGQAPKQRYELY